MYKVKANPDKEYQIEFTESNFNTGTINGDTFILDILKEREGRFHLITKSRSYTVELLEKDETGKKLSLMVNGSKIVVEVKDKYDVLLKSLGMDAMLVSKINEMKAPMPGLVLDIRVEEGQEIKKGDPVLVLEAMKMENILKSPSDGTVKAILVKRGIAVEKNQVLIHFE